MQNHLSPVKYVCSLLYSSIISRGFRLRFFLPPFKTQRNKNVTQKSYSLLYSPCSTHVLMVSAFIFISSFALDVSRYGPVERDTVRFFFLIAHTRHTLDFIFVITRFCFFILYFLKKSLSPMVTEIHLLCIPRTNALRK